MDVGNNFIQHILYSVPNILCNVDGPIVANSNLYQPCHGSGGIPIPCTKSLCTSSPHAQLLSKITCNQIGVIASPSSIYFALLQFLLNHFGSSTKCS